MILVIVVILVAVGAIVYFQFKPKLSHQPEVSQPTPSPIQTPIDETANWKTYKNEKYKFEVKYPQTHKIIDTITSENIIVFGNIKEEKITREKRMGEFTGFNVQIFNNNRRLELREWVYENLSSISGQPTTLNTLLVAPHYIFINNLKTLQYQDSSMFTPSHTLFPNDNLVIDIVSMGIEDGTYNQILSTFQFID